MHKSSAKPHRFKTHAPRSKLKLFFAKLGPGLVTGAADDDPSGVGTYSQVGAQFGFGMGWAILFSYPLLASIQAISAEIGSVTGAGVAQNLDVTIRAGCCKLWSTFYWSRMSSI